MGLQNEDKVHRSSPGGRYPWEQEKQSKAPKQQIHYLGKVERSVGGAEELEVGAQE